MDAGERGKVGREQGRGGDTTPTAYAMEGAANN